MGFEFFDIQATTEWRFTLKCVCDMIQTYNQMHHTDKYSQNCSIIWVVLLNSWMFLYELSGCGFKSRYNEYTSDIAPILTKEFLGIQATTECRFTLKRTRDTIRANSHSCLRCLRCFRLFKGFLEGI